MIFLLFLFIAGVSIPFSFAKRKAKGETMQKIYRHVFLRMITLVIFGIIYNQIFMLHDFLPDPPFGRESRRPVSYNMLLYKFGFGQIFIAHFYTFEHITFALVLFDKTHLHPGSFTPGEYLFKVNCPIPDFCKRFFF